MKGNILAPIVLIKQKNTAATGMLVAFAVCNLGFVFNVYTAESTVGTNTNYLYLSTSHRIGTSLISYCIVELLIMKRLNSDYSN